MKSFDDVEYRHDLLNDKFINEIIFNQKENGYYVEIGACEGYITSQTYFFERFKNWNGIVVEPNPLLYSKLKEIRHKSVIETSAVLDVNDKIEFAITDIPEWCHIHNGKTKIKLEESAVTHIVADIINVIEIETITLKSMLDKFNAPKEIDFISIDAEESEIKILKKFFNENNNLYHINLFVIECGDEIDNLISLFKNKPYTKIKNPYLNYLKIHPINYGIIRLNNDNEFYSSDMVKYEGSILDLVDIETEHYYIHNDYLNDNPYLKKLII